MFKAKASPANEVWNLLTSQLNPCSSTIIKAFEEKLLSSLSRITPFELNEMLFSVDIMSDRRVMKKAEYWVKQYIDANKKAKVIKGRYEQEDGWHKDIVEHFNVFASLMNKTPIEVIEQYSISESINESDIRGLLMIGLSEWKSILNTLEKEQLRCAVLLIDKYSIEEGLNALLEYSLNTINIAILDRIRFVNGSIGNDV